MHQNLVKTEDFGIAWLEGSACLLATVYPSMQGFRGVSTFFSNMRQCRSKTRADAWILDVRNARKIPEELWSWVESSWFPQLVDEGLKRQALLVPASGAARSQWEHLQINDMKQEVLDSLPLAVSWISEDPNAPPARRRPILTQLRAAGVSR
ncbi:MAG: hypothetical protein AAGA23_04320 [Pseudomonadota bacterium]